MVVALSCLHCGLHICVCLWIVLELWRFSGSSKNGCGFSINSGGIVVGFVLALETGAALKSLAILLSKGIIINFVN